MKPLTDKQLDRLHRLLPPTIVWFKATKAEIADCQKLEERGLCEEVTPDGERDCRLYRILPDGLRALADADEQGRLVGLADRVKEPPPTIGMSHDALLKRRATAAGRMADSGSSE